MADALDSGSSESNFIWVQVPSSAPNRNNTNLDKSRFVFFLAPLGWNKPPVLLGEEKGFSKAKTGELDASPRKKLKKEKPSDIM